MKNYITPIKNQLDEAMHLHCNGFMLLGSPNETPRYYNVKGFDSKTETLTICSTQKSDLFFEIDCKGLDFSKFWASDFWAQFKEYRTAFLLQNYPTISSY